MYSIGAKVCVRVFLPTSSTIALHVYIGELLPTWALLKGAAVCEPFMDLTLCASYAVFTAACKRFSVRSIVVIQAFSLATHFPTSPSIGIL